MKTRAKADRSPCDRGDRRGTLCRGVNLASEELCLIDDHVCAPPPWGDFVRRAEAGSSGSAGTVTGAGEVHSGLDGAFWFQTGSGTRKGRNVASDSRCSIAVSIRDADVVVEGDAAGVTDAGILLRIAKTWADSGWAAELDEGGSGINAPSQRPPPWHVYRVEPRSATVVLGIDPGRLTRFRF